VKLVNLVGFITKKIAHLVYKDSVHTAQKALYASTILLTVLQNLHIINIYKLKGVMLLWQLRKC